MIYILDLRRKIKYHHRMAVVYAHEEIQYRSVYYGKDDQYATKFKNRWSFFRQISNFYIHRNTHLIHIEQHFQIDPNHQNDLTIFRNSVIE
eukprot:UN15213